MASDQMGLRKLLLDWYDANDVRPAEGRRRIAVALDMSPRQVEKIEQTGAFRYAELFKIGLKTV